MNGGGNPCGTSMLSAVPEPNVNAEADWGLRVPPTGRNKSRVAEILSYANSACVRTQDRSSNAFALFCAFCGTLYPFEFSARRTSGVKLW